MLFSGKSFQNFCHLNVNMKLVTLTVILMSITFHHTHAQSCGSWKQAQSRAHCIGGSIGLTKRIVESFQNRKASGDLEDSRQIETRQDYENSNEMTPQKLNIIVCFVKCLKIT
ncbi:uncharacterized protein LOC102801362 [Saccoglossus kowalevskii]